MRALILLVSLMPFSAFAEPTVELVGECLKNVDDVLTDLGDSEEPEWNEASVGQVNSRNGSTLEVWYTRNSPDSLINGEAQVELNIFKEKTTGDLTEISECKVLGAEILDERAD